MILTCIMRFTNSSRFVDLVLSFWVVSTEEMGLDCMFFTLLVDVCAGLLQVVGWPELMG